MQSSCYFSIFLGCRASWQQNEKNEQNEDIDSKPKGCWNRKSII